MRTLLLLPAVLLAGCGIVDGRLDYARPYMAPQSGANVKVVPVPRDTLWLTSVASLGKQFFVINNIDKSSGLINISYSGDPEQYVDCGRVTSYVKNMQGERSYNFPAAKADMEYEVLTGINYFKIRRKVQLEGRVNLIFEDVPNGTRVTANTKYIITRTQTILPAGAQFPTTLNDSISFNSGGGAAFPPTNQGASTECFSTGRLEQEILAAVN